MATIERSIEIGVPISAVHHQWTQFAELPRFVDVGSMEPGRLASVARSFRPDARRA